MADFPYNRRMGRFQRSYALAKESLVVLRSNPQLLAFPIVSSLFTIALTISFAIPFFLAAGGPEGFKDPKNMPPMYYVVMAVFYLLSYFIVIFFNSGLVSCAYASLRGEPNVTFAYGLREAAKRLPAILGWTLIAATVGLILQMISERSGIVGKIIVAIVGGAWNLVTFFVVPVIVVEQGSPVAAIKKSAGLLKRTWGENLIGGAGIALAFLFFMLIPVVPIILACLTGSVTAILITIGVSVLYWMLLATICASLTGIYRTALYIYAETGAVPAAFDAEALKAAFTVGKPNMVNRLRNR
jgi:hypothetical protein